MPESLSGWLSLLEQLHPSEIDMGLERVATVFAALNIHFKNSTVITVAGTNGKGSTCRFIESIALELGLTTGVYSSPHITDYVERVRINDAVLSEEQHCLAFEKVFAARNDIPLTYFEFGTLAAFELLAQAAPDIVILEIGLGGRLDAVNVVEPDISVLTTIGLDHQAWLGDTKEQIAIEKAGIARSNKQCIVGEAHPPKTLAPELMRLQARELWSGKDFFYMEEQYKWKFVFENDSQKIAFFDLPYGNLLTQNIATALATVCSLGWEFSKAQLIKTIENTTLPGRYQKLDMIPRVILDVAHNHQATEVLARRIKDEEYESLYIVAGMLSDKDSVSSLSEFRHLHANWFVAPLDTPRSASIEVLNSALSFSDKVTSCESISRACEQVFAHASEKDLVLVFGSFYTISEFRNLSKNI